MHRINFSKMLGQQNFTVIELIEKVINTYTLIFTLYVDKLLMWAPIAEINFVEAIILLSPVPKPMLCISWVIYM